MFLLIGLVFSGPSHGHVWFSQFQKVLFGSGPCAEPVRPCHVGQVNTASKLELVLDKQCQSF